MFVNNSSRKFRKRFPNKYSSRGFFSEKSSSRTISRVLYLHPKVRCLSFIQTLCRHKAQCYKPPAFYPPAWAGYPYSAGLHELAAPKMHSRVCHHTAGGLLPHLLTLTPCGAVVFFCITQPSRIPSILGSGMPCAARTFLSGLATAATDRPTAEMQRYDFFFTLLQC